MSDSLWPATLAGGKLDRYFHVCAFFNSRDEQYDVLLPFVKEGIDWKEQALHIWDAKLFEDHRCRLKEGGIDTATAEEKGQLQILDGLQVYLQDGRFEPDTMLRTVEGALAAGREQGYARTRILGHMQWALDGHPGTERLIEYEIKVNEVLSRSRQPACCIYDINKLSAGLMMDILRAHPATIVGGVLHENPFYSPPEDYLRELQEDPRHQRQVA